MLKEILIVLTFHRMTIKKKKLLHEKIFISGRCPEKILLRDIVLDITVGNETTSCLLIT